MADQEYVLCMWNKRLWPAKVKQIQLCCIFRISVNGADAVPLMEECIEEIASNLGEEMAKHLLPCIYSEYKIYTKTQPGGQ
uniref:Uncharacterized protein n=1 Tax=Bubo bubo TaxID=30461 RepID=A0A8C0EY48_BUBBB